MTSRKGQTAWLVRWKWTGEFEAEEEIAAILRPRLAEKIVGEIIASLYASTEFTAREIAAWCRKPKENPCLARWHDGVCTCGHNPWLVARLVSQLTVERDPATDLETIRWLDPPLYETNPDTGKRERRRDEVRRLFERRASGPLRVLRPTRSKDIAKSKKDLSGAQRAACT